MLYVCVNNIFFQSEGCDISSFHGSNIFLLALTPPLPPEGYSCFLLYWQLKSILFWLDY